MLVVWIYQPQYCVYSGLFTQSVLQAKVNEVDFTLIGIGMFKKVGWLTLSHIFPLVFFPPSGPHPVWGVL